MTSFALSRVSARSRRTPRTAAGRWPLERLALVAVLTGLALLASGVGALLAIYADSGRAGGLAGVGVFYGLLIASAGPLALVWRVVAAASRWWRATRRDGAATR